MDQVSVEDLLAHVGELLELELLTGRAGLGRAITVSRIQKPSLFLTGFPIRVHPGRIQVLGGAEVSYLESLSGEARGQAVQWLSDVSPTCVVVTGGREIPGELLAAAEAAGLPLLRSRLPSSQFISRVTRYLEAALAPSTLLHGVLLNVLGMGILLRGKSGIGKSECALDLVFRGHRLIADDVVEIRKFPPSTLIGSGKGIIRHYMEIRGLGIINIKELFGITAIEEMKEINLVIELVEWEEDHEYDRLGLKEERFAVLDMELPLLRIPVRYGRNTASIVEVAARNFILRSRGVNTAREFEKLLERELRGRKEGP